jgi:hypothetical protein
MSESSITINFEGLEPDKASLYAGQLRDAILEAAPQGVNVSLGSSNPNSLQFGQELFIDLTAAVLAHVVVKAVELFILQSGVTLRVVKKKGEGDEKVEVVLDHVRPDTVDDLQKMLPPKKE